MKYGYAFFLFIALSCGQLAAQPWNSALMIAAGSDGTTFNSSQVFQDSSGVPSVIQLSDGRLLAAFQWFPAPVMGDNWDSIAVKISTDTGATWTAPIHCNFTGMPPNFWRPFDPAIVETSTGQVRMYFSTGPTGSPSLDSTINTYSAISSDGINYAFEGGIRYDDVSLPVIDPAVTFFGGVWQYTAPRGAPQAGAFHATSTDGLNFTPLATIPSDNTHQWTGNLMVDGSTMRFYGAGPNGIWWSSSADGNTWSGFNATNITAGGDPTVLRLPDSTYIIIYVGPPNLTGAAETTIAENEMHLFPNPSCGDVNIRMKSEGDYQLRIFDAAGREVMLQAFTGTAISIDTKALNAGLYFVEVFDAARNVVYREKLVR